MCKPTLTRSAVCITAALFAFGVVVVGNVMAQPITVTNFSFEDPDVGPGGFTTTAPPGWGGGFDAGVHNAGDFTSPIARSVGGQVGFLGNGGGFTNFFQDIVVPGGTDINAYRFTVRLAHRGDPGPGNINVGLHDLNDGVAGIFTTSVNRLDLNNTYYRDFSVEIPSTTVAAGDTLRIFTDKTAGNLVVLDGARLTAVTSDPTLAYWRFEGGPANTNVVHGAAPAYPNYAPDVPDASGNGNELSMWDTGGGTGFQYRSDVTSSTVTQTGDANNFSIKNTGGFPASFSEPNGPLSSVELDAWTVEASWKPENGGFRTVVGRDAQGVSSLDGNLAAFYLQATPADELRVQFTDEAGFTHEAVSAPGTITGFDFGSDPDGVNGVWHNIAATSDGDTLSLFLGTGDGYELVAQTDLTASGSTNTALTDGFNVLGGVAGAADWGAGDWTVGRGLFAGGHADRAFGFIDEVRISNVALAPDQLLFAVPEPASIAIWSLLGLTLGGFGYYRMRRTK